MDDQPGATPEVTEQDERLSLPWAALLIVALPLAVFFLSDQLISTHGVPVDFVPEKAAFNGNAEAAGRLRVLATFLLLVGAVVAIVAHFALSLGRLDPRSKRILLALYGLVVLVGVTAFLTRDHRETQEFVGQRLVCTMLSLPAPPVLRPPDAGGATLPITDPGACAAQRYRLLRQLIEIERLLLLLAIPAVVLGAVTSLARCSERLSAERRRELRHMQVEHLNMALYLAALLLVIGLLFVGAFLTWPGYALEAGALAAYRSHASAIVLFYGATYSVLLASYYIPTVMLLTQEPAQEPCGPEGGDAPSPLPPLAVVRVGLAVFAPVIVSLLGDVVKLPV